MDDQRGFNLEVVFQGLCVFVPRTDGHKAWVFMPKEVDANLDIQRKKMKSHFPRVQFDLGDLQVARADGTVVRGPKNATGLLELKFSDLIILPDGDDRWRSCAELDIDGFDPSCSDVDLPIPETASISGSFSYLASLEKACAARGCGAGGGQIIPELLQPKLRGFKDVLAARIKLTVGKLSVGGLGLNEDERLVAWRFKPYKAESRPHDHVQVIGTTVRLKIRNIKKYVRLEAHDLGDGELQSAVNLVGKPGGNVVVHIFNEESEQFLRPVARSSIKLGKVKKQDRILESYYKLMRNAPPFGKRPIPVADYIIPLKGNGADSSPPCSPVRGRAVEEPRPFASTGGYAAEQHDERNEEDYENLEK